MRGHRRDFCMFRFIGGDTIHHSCKKQRKHQEEHNQRQEYLGHQPAIRGYVAHVLEQLVLAALDIQVHLLDVIVDPVEKLVN